MDVKAAQNTSVSTTEHAQSPSTKVPHVVIIGGGFGGLQAAKKLEQQPVEVTIIDHNNFHLFQPMLYQVSTGGLSPSDIAVPLRAILHGQQNTGVLMAKVTGIDVQQQRVLMDDKQAIHYDYLIVATGAGSNYFGHPEWEKLAPGMKSINDALTIRRMVLSAFEAAERELCLSWRRANRGRIDRRDCGIGKSVSQRRLSPHQSEYGTYCACPGGKAHSPPVSLVAR